MLVDTRTKEAKLYKQPGATETAAMTSAEGKVQEKNYQATFPVMYNILGKPLKYKVMSKGIMNLFFNFNT